MPLGEQPRKERAYSIRSPVNWTVLSLVIERPSYGWELWNRFDRLYGDVLPIGNESSIYAALNALSKAGLIEEVGAVSLSRIIVLPRRAWGLMWRG
jgi:DNA-binding PadR family transcriptional regulator